MELCSVILSSAWLVLDKQRFHGDVQTTPVRLGCDGDVQAASLLELINADYMQAAWLHA